MSFQIKGYIELWNEFSYASKKDIFTTNTGANMEKYGFSKSTTKKSIINNILNDVYDQKKFDVTNEIYYNILGFKEEKNHYDIFEKVCLWVIEMNGCPIDNYWLYMTLEKFHSIDKKDIKKSLEIAKKSYIEIESYLPFLRESQNLVRKENNFDITGTYPNYVFCRDTLIHLLVDSKLYEEAESYENEMISRNLFPDKNGRERLVFNRIYRLVRHIEYLIKDNHIDEAILKTQELSKIDSKISSFHFKKIANYLLENKEYENAFKYFCIALDMNPAIGGVETEIKKLSDILSLNYDIDKNAIIGKLKRQEESLSNSYELLDIAKRYYEIEEYENAIKLTQKLIQERGCENTLLLYLSKIYKTMANREEKINNHSTAIIYYSAALDVFANVELPIKTIEKQIEIIKKSLDKVRQKRKTIKN